MFIQTPYIQNFIKNKIFIKFILITNLFFLVFQNSYSQSIYSNNFSDRIANYTISVELEPKTKVLTGKMLLEWTNTSTDSITELQFHMYLNAFKNSSSTFMRERDEAFGGIDFTEFENMWGWIDIISIKIADGEILTSNMKYIQPDDNNIDDQTVLALTLDKPISSQEIVNLEITFIAKLPEIIARTGYSDDYFFVGQWFPKIGVLESKGIRNSTETKWNCHQYHSQSEFYADFGVYNVDITLPEEYIVGATGFLTKRETNEDGSKTHYYTAKDVVDFAWAASPDFVEYEKVWKGTIIKALMQPEHESLAYRHINATILAINYFEENLGEYPYPNITIIDPPFKGMKSGGMEYPTLFTTMSLSYMPFSVKIPEMVTIHEFGHNYFMGILATNEFEEPWLDEGFNSYYESKILKNNYPVFSFLGYNIEDIEIQRAGYTLYFNPQITDIDNFAWNFPLGSYSVMSYNKPALVLKTMENLVGEETMLLIMKTYYDRWKFKHPCSNDFIEIANEIIKQEHGNDLGKNFNWFFQQTIFGTGICDFKLASISNTLTSENTSGVYDQNGVKLTVVPEETPYIYQSKVVIYRLGDVKIPVEIQVHFENGDEIIEKWDGEESLKTYFYTGTNKVTWAKVDYLDKILIDINRNNNSFTLENNNLAYLKYTNKFLFWLQNFIQTIGFLV